MYIRSIIYIYIYINAGSSLHGSAVTNLINIREDWGSILGLA